MNREIKELCEKLVKVPDLVYFSIEKPIRCAPEDFTPIFFNFKKALSHGDTRAAAASELTKLVDTNVDYICGVESGGSYYASYIADALKKPLIFLRLTEKEFKISGDNERIVGPIPPKKSTIALIDDVFATAITTREALEFFEKLEIRCKIYTLFSYGHNKVLGEKLKTEVSSLIMYKDLISQAVLAKIINKDDVKLITQHVNKYDKYI